MLTRIANYLHKIFEYDSYDDEPDLVGVMAILGIVTAGVATLVMYINIPQYIYILNIIYGASVVINLIALFIYYRYVEKEPHHNCLTTLFTTVTIFGVFGANGLLALTLVIIAVAFTIANIFKTFSWIGPKLNETFAKLNVNK